MKKTKLIIALIFFTTLIGKAQYTKLYDFDSINGSYPSSGFYTDGTFFYGTTFAGGTPGSFGYGTIFKIKTDGTSFTKLFTFDSINGSAPFNGSGSLISDGTFLYGTNWNDGVSGGQDGTGNVFKIKPDGTGFDTLISFNATTSDKLTSGPSGSLIFDGTYLYGLSASSGNGINWSVGNIYKIKPDGSSFDTVFCFNGTNGYEPEGSLFFDGTFLYGMTGEYSNNSYGNIFKVKPDGTGHTILHEFNGTDGLTIGGTLISDGTFLYGVSCNPNVNNLGNIFKIKPDGTDFNILLNFNGANGGYPSDPLIYDGTYLYGTTDSGGTSGYGTIFKIKPDGTGYSQLFNFNSVNGNRVGSIISDGTNFYGVTTLGGVHGFGTIFKFQYCTGSCGDATGISSTNIEDTNISVYPNPMTDIINIEIGQFENVQIKINDVLEPV